VPTPWKNNTPNLYNIAQKKSATVDEIFSTRTLNVSFRRSLVADNLHSWHHLIMRLANIHLRERWDIVPYSSYLWKIKIPLKINVFLWLLYRETILTNDNLVKRNWHKNQCVAFVIIMKPYNISFLSAHSVNLYGE
jgi:hypothetical protein